MSSNNQQSAVIGGGLAGIVTALILAQKGHKVTLIETADTCGGLLQTDYNDDGVPFDYGTHIPKEIGIPGLDSLLFSDFSEDKWQRLDRLRVGGYYRGEMYPTSQFVNLKLLPEETYNRAVVELLNTSPLDNPAELNALEFSLGMYGETMTQEIIEPLMQKLYGASLEQLQPSALGLVGYSRFIAFDRFQTHEIKKSPFYDSKLGFTTWDDGLSELMNFYPTESGVHIWMDSLLEKLETLGVRILTSTAVDSVSCENKQVTSIKTSNGETLDVTGLYWTASPAFLLRALDLPMPEGITPPKFRSTALVNFVFDRDFQTDLYFFYNHEPDKITYRTTLYSNLREKNRGEAPYNCTVEIMSDEETVHDPELPDKLLKELEEMAIISAEHQVTYQKVIASSKGFPLPSTGFHKNAVLLTDHCQSQASNIHLFGRATGKTHFMHDVLAEIWNELNAS
ncbi:MAG: NAD(P)/FAD-dependent oxidoreductase [Akkermansiaceae bacterium]